MRRILCSQRARARRVAAAAFAPVSVPVPWSCRFYCTKPPQEPLQASATPTPTPPPPPQAQAQAQAPPAPRSEPSPAAAPDTRAVDSDGDAAASPAQNVLRSLAAVADAAKVATAGINEEQYLAVGCAVVALVVWYWTSAATRRVRRLCDASEATVRDSLRSIEEQMVDLKKKWETDMKSREAQVRAVQQQNSDLTKHIDQLSSELKRCQID